MFMFIWREFRRNVKPIIESLKRKQAMLSDDKLQQHAILKSVQDSDLYAKDQFGQIQSGLDDVINLEEARRQKQEIEQIMSCLERKLNVSLAQIISQLELPDMVIESSGRWVLSNLRFQSWEVNESSEGCVLYLNGCPGAGKSLHCYFWCLWLLMHVVIHREVYSRENNYSLPQRQAISSNPNSPFVGLLLLQAQRCGSQII